MVFGLKGRVTLAFGVLSLAVALAVSGTAYLFARSYLVTQRESAGITRALLDARAVSIAVQGGADPGDAIADVPVVGGVQALARVDGTWYTRGVAASPADVPVSLLDEAERSGAAHQRFLVSDGPVFGVAVVEGDDVYLELSPMSDLDRALRTGGWFVVTISLLALLLGGLLGAWAAQRLLRPVGTLSAGAVRLAQGDLGVRLPPTSDPDLAPLSTAFNDMADAVE
jgi:methyl-accepting chemotaxis protein